MGTSISAPGTTGMSGSTWIALFLRPALLRPQVMLLADRLREHRVDAVCGPMEGGAFLAYALADLMGVAVGGRCGSDGSGTSTAGLGGGGGREWRVGVGADEG